MLMMMLAIDRGENAATAPSGPLVVPAHAALHTGMLFRFDHHINHSHCHHHHYHINNHHHHHFIVTILSIIIITFINLILILILM